jgi:tetratricopeptide (TPR) repeat protein
MRSSAPSIPNGSFSVRNIVLLALLTVLCLTKSSAQQAISPTPAATTDPRIQQLEMEAKAAATKGDEAAAAEKYEAMLEIDPHLAPVYYDLGVLYVRLGEYPKAVTILRKGLQIDPGMHSPAALLGISLYQMGEYAEARPELDTAVRAAPKDINLELFLVKDLMALEEYDAAESHLADLAKRAPDNQEIWYLLGTVHLDLSRAAFAKLDAIDPNSSLAHEIKGDVKSDMQDYDGALAEYEKVVQMAPNEPGAHYKLGNVYWKLIDWPNAKREFEAELANNPGNCNAQWKLGNILLEQHVSPDQALANIDKALSICPNLISARSDRGRALIRLNRFADALPDLETVAKATPDATTIHFLLAQAYRGLGRMQDAQAEMETFSKLDQAARAATAATATDRMKPNDTPSEK